MTLNIVFITFGISTDRDFFVCIAILLLFSVFVSLEKFVVLGLKKLKLVLLETALFHSFRLLPVETQLAKKKIRLNFY